MLSEIQRTGALDYKEFLARRAKRLLPALSALLLTYALLAPQLFPELAGRRWFDIATTAFYVTNLRETFWPANTPLSHTWSLAIEEQFYIFWPFAVLWLNRFSPRRAVSWLFVSWIALTLARTAWTFALTGPAPYYFTAFHGTGLIVGAMVAFRRPSLRMGRWAFAALLILIIVGMARLTHLIPQTLADRDSLDHSGSAGRSFITVATVPRSHLLWRISLAHPFAVGSRKYAGRPVWIYRRDHGARCGLVPSWLAVLRPRRTLLSRPSSPGSFHAKDTGLRSCCRGQLIRSPLQRMSASVMGPCVKLPRFILPLVTCFCPWSA